MKLLGFDIIKTTNQDKKQPEQVNIYKNVVKTQLVRERQDIKKWRNALQSAESIQMPNRSPLMKVYQDIILDAHLNSLIKTRKHLLTASPFNLYSNGEIDEEATKSLDQQWFYEFLNLALDSVFYGFEVIQFGDIKNEVFTWVRKIPEQYLVPEYGIIKKSFGAESVGIKYNEKPYDVWCIPVGNAMYDFGLLNYATPLVLYKKNALGYWSDYCELFGVPIRKIHTNTRDEDRRRNAEEMMENMGSAGWGVFDTDDIFDTLSDGKTDAYNVFDKLVDRSNGELSKLILGVTMATDNGSSRSQAEVHENILKKYTISDKRMITGVINDKLLPLLKFHRMIPENIDAFNFEDIDVLEVMDVETIVKDLQNNYDFDTDELSDKFGLTITEKVVDSTNTMTNVANEYGKQYHKIPVKDFGDFKNIKTHKILRNGIEILGGITKDGNFDIYGYNVPDDSFTEGQAKKWVKDNGKK